MIFTLKMYIFERSNEKNHFSKTSVGTQKEKYKFLLVLAYKCELDYQLPQRHSCKIDQCCFIKGEIQSHKSRLSEYFKKVIFAN